MSRVATPAEKIMAVAATHRQLMDEMPVLSAMVGEPNVQVALIDAAVRIAMSTDTRDLGILHPDDPVLRTPDQAKPMDYAQMWLDGGEDPTFDQIDGFLYRHFNARAVHIDPVVTDESG